MKPSFTVIPMHIYPFDVCVSINQGDDEILESLNGQPEPDGWSLLVNLPDTCRGRTVMSPGNLTVIRLFIDGEVGHDTIAHEIFHAATFILDRVGMKLELMVSDEAYSYLIGYLTKNIYGLITSDK